MKNLHNKENQTDKTKNQAEKVPGLVIICGWFLILEAIIYFLLGVYHFHLNNGPALFTQLFARWISGDTPFSFSEAYKFSADLIHTASSAQLLIALIESGILFFLTVLALWTAVGFFRRWVIAWTLGLLVQFTSLLTALILYFVNRPAHIIIMMITGILMVLYLNYAEIPSFFNEPMQSTHKK